MILCVMKKLFILFQYLLPQHLLSRTAGFLMNCRWRWFKHLMILWFIQHYHVDVFEAERENICDYVSFNDFFTRKLKGNARPISNALIVSPVDGVLSQRGKIQAGRLIQAKQHDYALDDLLAHAKWSEKFKDGFFATLYLSPKDYHRVHMPCDGQLMETVYVPGKLFSVNDTTTHHVPNLFARNERLICRFRQIGGEKKECVVIFVGAMIVAGIHTVWSGKVTPNKHASTYIEHYAHKKIVFEKGEEIGHFEMGSTVIMLFEPKQIVIEKTASLPRSVRVGEEIF